MKLIEKKCPNCGAELKFGLDDKETKCEYCGKSFVIERDVDETSKKEELYNADNYKFLEETNKAITKGMGFFFLIPAFFIIVVSIIIFTSIFSFRDNKNDTVTNNIDAVEYPNDSEKEKEEEPKEEEVKKTDEELLKEKGYIVKFNDLTDKQINDIHENTLTILNDETKTYDVFLYPYSKWNYVGMYLLTSRNDNILYDVYSINFTIKGKKVTYYAGIRYFGVKLKDGILSMNMAGSKVGSLNQSSKIKEKATYGFESSKDFYNKNIRGLLEKYKVTISGKVYNE